MGACRRNTTTRILALAPNWLGDAAMCTPALRALHQRYPDGQLTVAGRSGICALLEDLPWIDHLDSIPEKPSMAQMMRLAAKMRSPGFDTIVVFPHSFRAALLALLIGGSQRIGYTRNSRQWLFTQAKRPYQEQGRITPIYMAQEYLELVALLGCEDDGKGLELGVCERVAQEIEPQLAGDGPLIGIAPGAAFGPSKRWLPEKYVEVVNRLASEANARFVLLIGPGEESIRDALTASTHVNFIEPKVTEKGLPVLKAITAKLDLLICNDSGPRHIAVAFKRPVVCVMGPTSPRYSDSPYEIGEVIRLSLECSPCQKPVCPLEHHRCMREITPEQVTEAALRVLQTRHRLNKDNDL